MPSKTNDFGSFKLSPFVAPEEADEQRYRYLNSIGRGAVEVEFDDYISDDVDKERRFDKQLALVGIEELAHIYIPRGVDFEEAVEIERKLFSW